MKINGYLLILLLIIFSQPLSARKNDKKIEDQSIREIMDAYYDQDEFVVGASSRTQYLRKPSKVYDRWLEEFSYNTPENDFKQHGVCPDLEAKWNNKEYMKYVDIARENGQIIRAHGPISPQCSRWMREDTRSAEDMEKMLHRFMSGLSKDIQANRDVIKWMDVVNETLTGSLQRGIGYDASQTSNVVVYNADDWFGPRVGNDSWENPWTVMGFETVEFEGEEFEMPRYIRMAFEVAQKHAPDVKKMYNTHGKTINPAQWKKLKKVILYLRSQGIVIDAIGWQGHVSLGWEKDPENIKNLQDVITWCCENDMEFHVTELDVMISRNKDAFDLATLEETYNEQASTIVSLVEVLLQNINKGAHGVNFWQMTDRYNQRTTFASLFDMEGNPHPAYYELKKLLVKYGQK